MESYPEARLRRWLPPWWSRECGALFARSDQLLTDWRFASKLPNKFKSYVWLHVCLTTPCTACHLRSPSTGDIKSINGFCLSQATGTVLCKEYRQDLIIMEHSDTTSQVLGAAQVVRFTIYLGGVCAITLDNQNWKSDWIGQMPTCSYNWHGKIWKSVSIQCLGYNVNPLSDWNVIAARQRSTQNTGVTLDIQYVCIFDEDEPKFIIPYFEYARLLNHVSMKLVIEGKWQINPSSYQIITKSFVTLSAILIICAVCFLITASCVVIFEFYELV